MDIRGFEVDYFLRIKLFELETLKLLDEDYNQICHLITSTKKLNNIFYYCIIFYNTPPFYRITFYVIIKHGNTLTHMKFSQPAITNQGWNYLII